MISHFGEKDIAKEMWDTLRSLFEAKNVNKKMALRDKLHSNRMVKRENMASHLTWINQVKDELHAVGGQYPKPRDGVHSLEGLH